MTGVHLPSNKTYHLVENLCDDKTICGIKRSRKVLITKFYQKCTCRNCIRTHHKDKP